MPGTNNEPWDGEVEILGGPRGPRPAVFITVDDIAEMTKPAGGFERRTIGMVTRESQREAFRCLRPEH